MGRDDDELAELVRRSQAQDADALQAIYDRYHKPIEGLIRRRLSPQLRRRYDTRDLVQSVFMEVMRDLPRFEYRGEPELKHWLYIKAESKVWAKFRRDLGADRKRQENRLPSGFEPRDDAESPSGDAQRREEREALDALLEGLDGQQRELLRLRYDEGLQFEAIAQEMGLPSADAARKRLARCIAALGKTTAGGR